VRTFIVIEGLIGVGKSTLSRLLRDEWGAKLVLEPAADNPFLEPYYQDPARFALPVQFFYLITRWRQQATIRQTDLFESMVVSDYLFAKDRLFAEKTLPPDELALYDQFMGALGGSSPTPDLLVYLEAPTAVLMKRIEKRNAPGEERITTAYLEDLRIRYDRLLAGWDRCPVLRLDNRDMDVIVDPAARRRLLNMIDTILKTGALPNTPGSDSDREVQPSLFGSGG
jgi:deoxyguanosine kinase